MKKNTLQTLTGSLAIASLAALMPFNAQAQLASGPTAKPDMSAFGDNWQGYTVDGADARDFHVCMEGSPANLTDAEIKSRMIESLDMVEGTNYPRAWTYTAGRDATSGRWCVNFYRGNAKALAGPTYFSVHYRKMDKNGKRIDLFEFNGGENTTLYVTDSATVGETNWSGSTLYTSPAHAKIRGPKLSDSVQAPPAIPPTEGRIVMTGAVSAGAPATASVIGPAGVTLSGVVVDVNGKQYVTDKQGRILFGVAAGATALVAALPGNSASAISVPVVALAASTAAPAVTTAPAVISTGQTFPISGTGFSGDAAGNTVRMGGTQLNVLASSPSQLVVSAPAQAPLGAQELSVTTDQGSSVPQAVSLVAIRLESKSTALRTGQKGEAQLIVEGADRPVTLNVINLAPQTIGLEGGNAIQVRTSGGGSNRARITYRGLTPGVFRISAAVATAK